MRQEEAKFAAQLVMVPEPPTGEAYVPPHWLALRWQNALFNIERHMPDDGHVWHMCSMFGYIMTEMRPVVSARYLFTWGRALLFVDTVLKQQPPMSDNVHIQALMQLLCEIASMYSALDAQYASATHQHIRSKTSHATDQCTSTMICEGDDDGRWERLMVLFAYEQVMERHATLAELTTFLRHQHVLSSIAAGYVFETVPVLVNDEALSLFNILDKPFQDDMQELLNYLLYEAPDENQQTQEEED